MVGKENEGGFDYNLKKSSSFFPIVDSDGCSADHTLKSDDKLTNKSVKLMDGNKGKKNTLNYINPMRSSISEGFASNRMSEPEVTIRSSLLPDKDEVSDEMMFSN